MMQRLDSNRCKFIKAHTKSLAPKVSIIVPIYKVDDYLVQCLNSIMAQTLEEIEIILVDEGDLDRCREIIDFYADQDPRIVAIHEKNGGYGASVNKGMKLATGEYIGFVESDDFIAPTMYEKLYNYAKQLDVDLVKSPYYSWWDGDELSANPQGKKKLMPYADFISRQVPKNMAYDIWTYPAQLCSHPSIWAGIYRTDFLREHKLEFLAKGAYLDIYFRMQVYMAAKKIAWYNKPFYYWRITNPTSTNAVWNTKAGIERAQSIHALFQEEKQLFEKIAPYIIHEEYLNTFMRIKTESCTQEQLKQMYALIDDYPMEAIRKALVLNEKERRYLVEFRQHKIGLSAYWKRSLKWTLYNFAKANFHYIPHLLCYGIAAELLAIFLLLWFQENNVASLVFTASSILVFVCSIFFGAMFLGLKILKLPV